MNDRPAMIAPQKNGKQRLDSRPQSPFPPPPFRAPSPQHYPSRRPLKIDSFTANSSSSTMPLPLNPSSPQIQFSRRNKNHEPLF